MAPNCSTSGPGRALSVQERRRTQLEHLLDACSAPLAVWLPGKTSGVSR
jgi:hypothetical protein